jgi:hypothetical protein
MWFSFVPLGRFYTAAATQYRLCSQAGLQDIPRIAGVDVGRNRRKRRLALALKCKEDLKIPQRGIAPHDLEIRDFYHRVITRFTGTPYP